MGASSRNVGLAAAAAILAAATTGASGQTYTVTTLGQLPGSDYSEPLAINSNGEIVGRAVVTKFNDVTQMDEQVFVPVRWDSSGQPHQLDLLSGDVHGSAWDVNNLGQAAGESAVDTVSTGPGPIRVVIDDKAVLWDAGSLTPSNVNGLITGGDTGFNLKTAQAINDAGLIAGTSRRIGDTTGFDGFLIDAGGVATDLGANMVPAAINSNGAVVGEEQSQHHAFLWVGGVATDLHNAVGIGGVDSAATDVNDSLQIVGSAQQSASSVDQACVWNGNVATFLGDFGGGQSTAHAINNHGQIVGRAFSALGDPAPFGRMHAFLYENGTFKNLNDHIPAGSDWDHFSEAFDINDSGQIVGLGTLLGVGGQPFLLTPINTCPCELDGDAAQVDVFDLLSYLSLWFAQDPGAEFTGDSPASIDVFDLLEYLSCWFPASAGSCG